MREDERRPFRERRHEQAEQRERPGQCGGDSQHRGRAVGVGVGRERYALRSGDVCELENLR
jgi:hypothetical protein